MKYFWRAIKIGIGLGLLAWLVASVDFAELRRVAGQGDPWLLGAGLFMSLLSLPVFQAWRLHVLIVPYTQSWGRTLHVFFVGAFFNNLLPSNVGGDAVRLLYLQRLRGSSWGAPLALLLLHRLSGIGVILVVAGVYALFDRERVLRTFGQMTVGLPSLRALEIALALLALVALALVFMPRALRNKIFGRIRTLLRDCMTGVREVGAKAMTWLVVLSVGFQATRLLGFLYIVRYMGQDVGIGDLLMVMAVTAVLALVPITVGGLGVMEGSITIMLGVYGVSAPAAVAVALANRMVLLASALVGGILYVAERKLPAGPTPPA